MHLCTFVFFPKKAVFTLDLLIFDPLFQTPDAHFHPPKDHLGKQAKLEKKKQQKGT